MVGTCVAGSTDVLLRGLAGLVVNDSAAVAIREDVRVFGGALVVVLDH